jgi:hypothetical protein
MTFKVKERKENRRTNSVPLFGCARETQQMRKECGS